MGILDDLNSFFFHGGGCDMNGGGGGEDAAALVFGDWSSTRIGERRSKVYQELCSLAGGGALEGGSSLSVANTA